ncbi:MULTISPECIES: barstar family protein [unclassified Streptomyces]|uniref:barstar family protein n=1 Tax=unclassified Streptomyces TaxID=2593676 RepID=UPI000AE89836|nr:MULTISPECIES: barstar family protein [unclassified Streptomyces]
MISYRLVDEESGDVLLTAEDIRDFFVDQDLGTAQRFTFVRVHRMEITRRKSEGTELQVVDRNEEPIGKYYLGRVERASREVPEVGPGNYPDVDFFGYTCEYPKAGEIWKKWAEGVERGDWARQPPEWHGSWLHVAQTAWFTSGKRATRYETRETVFLDGTRITTRDAFFCALGEAVNGVGGYFGSSHGGLIDCLRTAQREHAPPFRLVWRDFASSRHALGNEFTDAVVSAFQEHGVAVTPEENRASE